MRRQLRFVATGIVLALLGAAVAVSPGCTKSYPYEVRGVVRSAADGHPLAGVNVTAHAGWSSDLPATTEADGSFLFTFRASSSDFNSTQLPKWTATMSREGYVVQDVEFSPMRRPNSNEPPTQFVLVVHLRATGP